MSKLKNVLKCLVLIILYTPLNKNNQTITLVINNTIISVWFLNKIILYTYICFIDRGI